MQNQNEDIPDIYEMPRNSLDLTFSKKIGKVVEIKAGIQDMLNSKIEYKQFVKLADENGGKREREQLVRSYRPGVDINVGVSSSFKVNWNISLLQTKCDYYEQISIERLGLCMCIGRYVWNGVL